MNHISHTTKVRKCFSFISFQFFFLLPNFLYCCWWIALICSYLLLLMLRTCESWKWEKGNIFRHFFSSVNIQKTNGRVEWITFSFKWGYSGRELGCSLKCSGNWEKKRERKKNNKIQHHRQLAYLHSTHRSAYELRKDRKCEMKVLRMKNWLNSHRDQFCVQIEKLIGSNHNIFFVLLLMFNLKSSCCDYL